MSKTDARRADKARKAAQLDERRRVVLAIYRDADAAIAAVLDELRAAGTTPSCRAGCAHCCHLEVPMSRAEAETLVAWLRAAWTAAQLDALAARLRAWLTWYRTRLPAEVAGGAQRGEAFLKTSPGCVLLDDAGACGAYPVRPMTCRNHYVTSPPEACGPTATRDTTVRSLPAAVDVTRPLVANLRRTVEQQGADFAASLHLIPEWLAHLLDVEQDPWRA